MRARAGEASRRFRFVAQASAPDPDPRLIALAEAVRQRRIVRIHAYRPGERVIHPVGLVCDHTGWLVEDALAPGAPLAIDACGDIAISSKIFEVGGRF